MVAVTRDTASVHSADVGLSRLVGREGECAVLDELLVDVGSGRSRALVVRGEPGIGKTALLDDFCSRARDVVLIRSAANEAESALAFAGLHHLCSQLAPEKLDPLPEPQRAAIRVALGQSARETPGPLLLGTGLLNYLADIAAERPVIAVIDDAQWLDGSTAQTLGFVARRLDAEAVGLIFAAREQVKHLRGLPELVLSGLAPADAQALLATALLMPVEERVRERFIAETMGNPLAIVELCHALPELEEIPQPRDSRGLWAQLEESFERRLDTLSPSARQLALVAAAESLGDPVVVWRAADLLRIPRSSADELESTGLVGIGVRVVFRHPLVRSAIYRQAQPAARRLAHEAIAEGLHAGSEYRVWHRALAAAGPAEEIAAELERSAGRATRRGGLGAAAAFLERAVLLSEDVESRGRRALVAAEAQLDAGQPSRAEEQISIAKLASQSDLDVGQREVLEARLASMRGRGRDAPTLLLTAAMRLDALGGSSTRDVYHRAMIAAIFAGRLSSGAGVADVAEAARSAPMRGPPTLRDRYMRSIASLVVEGHAAAAPLARELVADLRAGEFSTPDDAALLAMSIQLATILWDDEAWNDLASRGLKLARKLGCLDVLPIALCNQASTHVWQGEFMAASALVQQIRALSDATGVPELATPAMSVSVYGSPESAFTLIGAARQAAADGGQGLIVTFSQITEAILCNSLGRYEDALRAAASAYADPFLYNPYLLGEFLEAAARSGHPEQAAEARADLSARAAVAKTEWVRGIEARSEALFSEGVHAENLYRASIDHLQRTSMRVQVARGHLLYGEWLRREGRRVDARQRLRVACDMFGAMGALAFSERATRELAATGETVRKRTDRYATADELTVRERQIARLAAAGLSNREIGEQLFISHRTVGYHLAKVFTKLGVNNRALIREDMLR